MLWAARVYPQSSHSSLGLPTVPCYLSCDGCSVVILSQKLYEAELLCSVSIQSFFHARSTLNLQDRHAPWHRKGAFFWELPGSNTHVSSSIRPILWKGFFLSHTLLKALHFTNIYKKMCIRIHGHLFTEALSVQF